MKLWIFVSRGYHIEDLIFATTDEALAQEAMAYYDYEEMELDEVPPPVRRRLAGEKCYHVVVDRDPYGQEAVRVFETGGREDDRWHVWAKSKEEAMQKAVANLKGQQVSP